MKPAVLFETIRGNSVVLKISSHVGDTIIVVVSMADRMFNMMKVQQGKWKIFPANNALDLLHLEKDISERLDAAGY